MLGKLFGNFEERREEIKEGLKEISIETEINDGKIKIIGNAAREIKEIVIDDTLLSPDHKEELQDLLVTALNDYTQLATEAEMEASKTMLKDMLPPGLGGLSQFFE